MALFSPPSTLDGHRWRGMRVGVLGGSFNPPHAGHVHISNVAMAALHLDCVWWMVTPQNPLKDSAHTAPFADRMALCRDLTALHPRILISDLENEWGTRRTVDTLTQLLGHFPKTDFVFLAGTDIVPELPRWYRWRDIPAMVAMAFVARPPATSIIRHSPLHGLNGQNHHVLTGATKAPLEPGNCFWVLGDSLHPASSTNIRNNINIK